MSEEMAVAAQPGHSLKEAARYLIGIALGVIVLVLLFGKRGDLLAAWHQLVRANAGWVLAAVGAEGMSLLTYSLLQRYVLHLSGARIALGPLFVLTLANDAIANTVPGEPAVSSAYRYRHYRRRGASGASAGWTIFTIIIAQAIGMSLLLLLGVIVALTGSANGRSAAAAVVGLVIVACAVAVLARRDLVLRLVAMLVRAVRRITGYPRGRVAARIEATLDRMREIPLSARSTVAVVAIAAWVWCCDFLCLLCSFGAVHAPIPWSGVLLAYGVAQVVGSFPIIPGGIGVVEGSLAVILVAYGSDRVAALSAALAFRMVNFWLAIAVGWISVGLIAYRVRSRGDSGNDREAPAASTPAEDS